jgi:hypothetical protein
MRVSVVLASLPGMQIASLVPRFVLPSVVSLAVPCFFKRPHKLHDFRETGIKYEIYFHFLYICLKHSSF